MFRGPDVRPNILSRSYVFRGAERQRLSRVERRVADCEARRERERRQVTTSMQREASQNQCRREPVSSRTSVVETLDRSRSRGGDKAVLETLEATQTCLPETLQWRLLEGGA